jgi:hypothetical protein
MKITKKQLKQIIKEELNEYSQKQRGHEARDAVRGKQREKKEQEAKEIQQALGLKYEVHVRMLEGRYQITVHRAYTGEY